MTEPILRACQSLRIRAGEAVNSRGVVVMLPETFRRVFPDATREEHRSYDGDGWKWTTVYQGVIFRAYGK